MNAPDTTPLLTAAEVADLLRVSESTIKQWARAGVIPSVRCTPTTVRFDFSEVRAALKARFRGAPERGDRQSPAGDGGGTTAFGVGGQR